MSLSTKLVRLSGSRCKADQVNYDMDDMVLVQEGSHFPLLFLSLFATSDLKTLRGVNRGQFLALSTSRFQAMARFKERVNIIELALGIDIENYASEFLNSLNETKEAGTFEKDNKEDDFIIYDLDDVLENANEVKLKHLLSDFSQAQVLDAYTVYKKNSSHENPSAINIRNFLIGNGTDNYDRYWSERSFNLSYTIKSEKSFKSFWSKTKQGLKELFVIE